MNLSPTPRQRQVLALLRIQPQPSIRELGELLGVTSTNAVADHIKALARKGLVERAKGKARSVRLTRLGARWLR